MNKNYYSESSRSETDELIRRLKDKAYRLLARREYSAFELRQKFENLAPASICTQILEDLIQQGMQSDARFAEMLCRSRFNGGKGPVMLRHELNEHKIDPDLIERALAVYQDQWTESAARVRIRKFGEKPPANLEEWAKQDRFLQQRGFFSAQIDQFENAIVD
ncbi:regulatory protein RecX [Candidatus Spongiihabitans sp.]|uniref:regulatory protein RecX n=1 Tax=Candidatus Spongiihabitans sp. TaxID=3101308 RepID=UPI003C704843